MFAKRMALKLFFHIWAISSVCLGTLDIPFFDDSPICADNLDEHEEVPSFEFEKPFLPFEKRMEAVFYPDMTIPLAYLRPFLNEQENPFAAMMASPDTEFSSHLHLKKRSVNDDDDNLMRNANEPEQYDVGFLPSVLREARNKGTIKTIQLQSSFTPRLGRKRSDDMSSYDDQDSYTKNSMPNRARVIDLKAGSGFTPRLGRSEEKQKIHLQAGSGFTPRLGRSEKIRFNAGSAFTPRLGRSEGPHRIHLNAGNAFTPRLGRSDNPQRIQLQAGGGFTPRLGRSENGNRVYLNAGSAFTPRLGRSKPDKMHDGETIKLDGQMNHSKL